MEESRAEHSKRVREAIDKLSPLDLIRAYDEYTKTYNEHYSMNTKIKEEVELNPDEEKEWQDILSSIMDRRFAIAIKIADNLTGN